MMVTSCGASKSELRATTVGGVPETQQHGVRREEEKEVYAPPGPRRSARGENPSDPGERDPTGGAFGADRLTYK